MGFYLFLTEELLGECLHLSGDELGVTSLMTVPRAAPLHPQCAHGSPGELVKQQVPELHPREIQSEEGLENLHF